MLLLLPRGKKTSPFAFGCEQDGLGGGLEIIPGVTVNKKKNNFFLMKSLQLNLDENKECRKQSAFLRKSSACCHTSCVAIQI